MKFKLIDEEGNETEHEMAPIGEKEVEFPVLFKPKIGGREVPFSDLDDSQVMRELFEKTVCVDPDLRAYYFGEIFCQLMTINDFVKWFMKHICVNHNVDKSGRFFKVMLEFSKDGNFKQLNDDEMDLIWELE